MKKIKLTEANLTKIIAKVISEDEELGGMTSDPRIMAREYGERIELSPTQQALHDNIV